MLGHMTPSVADVDVLDSPLRNAVLGRDLSLRQSAFGQQIADVLHVGVCEFVATYAYSARRFAQVATVIPSSNARTRGASLLSSIGIVVSDRADHKMCWIAARRVVAGVHHHVARRWSAMSQVICHAMRYQWNAFIRDWVVVSETPVAAWLLGARPRPAVIGSAAINAIPEVSDESKNVTLWAHAQNYTTGECYR